MTTRSVRYSILVSLLGIVLLGTPCAQALTISVTYDDNMQDPNSTGTFNAVEKAVITQAISQWQNSICSPGNVNVTILKSNLAAPLLGFADSYTSTLGDTDVPPDGLLNGTPTGGRIRVDDRLGPGELPFWVDATPADNAEFNPGNTNYHFTAIPGGAAAGAHDLLSLVKHELGHVVGFSGTGFNNFAAGVAPSPVGGEAQRWLYAFGAAPTLGPPAQYLPGILPFGGVYLREQEDPPCWTPGPFPSHVDECPLPLGPAGPGVAAGFFPDDLMNPTLSLGERVIESDVDLDILADAYGYCVPEPSTVVLLVTAAIGLLICARRRRGPNK